VRIGLWAAATQADWLLPGCRHGRALSCVERGVIFYNQVDPALKCYQPVFCTATGPALGFSGLINPRCGPAEYSRLVQFDVTNSIGRHHCWNLYRHCACTMSQLRDLALSWEPCSPSEVSAKQKAQIKRLSALMPLIGRLC
jgi:hypothetical protein